MDPDLIKRINELARIAKERPLTGEEAAERAALRAEYLKVFRENTRNLLKTVKIQQSDGTITPLVPPDKS